MYWSDFKTSEIVSSNLAGGDLDVWNLTDIGQPEFLAIDEIGRNFYYSDYVREIIGVCKISKEKHCYGVITEGLNNPRGIAVASTRGLLAYSNWANHAFGKFNVFQPFILFSSK